MRKATHMVALCLFVSGALPGVSSAQMRDDFVMSLDSKNIRAFLEETNKVSLGQRDDMTPENIAAYLDRHLAPKGKFNSKTTFQIPGYPPQNADMKLDKQGYIDNVMQGRGLISGYTTAIEIKDIKISGIGKAATISTISTDSGEMPWPGENGEQKPVPISGKSTCEQTLIVSLDHYIQMAGAECVTEITNRPFGGKPLGEE
ncbi:MAG TPA: hypothetical protein VIG74_00385 [Alphaproteobacteria bacterium]